MIRTSLGIALAALLLIASNSWSVGVFGAGGFGFNLKYSTARAAALGGAVSTLADSVFVPLENPGGWYSQGRTRFAVNAVLRNMTASDATGSDSHGDLILPAMSLSLPIYRSIGLGVHYQTMYEHEYLFYGNIDTDLLDVEGKERFQGDGGISSVNVIAAGKIGRLGIGVGGELVFGKLEELWQLDFERSPTDTLESAHYRRYELSGFRPNVGLQAKPFTGTALAVNARFPMTMDASRITKVEGGDSVRTTGLDIEFPLGFGVGASQILGRYRGSVDYQMEMWEEVNPVVTASLPYRNAVDIGLGVERLPLRGALDPWFEKWMYRVGMRYYDSYIDMGVDQPEPVNSLGFGLGVGIPVAHSSGWIDIAATFEIRGNESTNGASERVFTLQLGWNLAQEWFVRRER
jgi:hypothetical protein